MQFTTHMDPYIQTVSSDFARKSLETYRVSFDLSSQTIKVKNIDNNLYPKIQKTGKRTDFGENTGIFDYPKIFSKKITSK